MRWLREGTHNGTTRPRDDMAASSIGQKLAGQNLSSGQLRLFLTLCRGAGIPAPFITRSIETQWDVAPYHLRLELLAHEWNLTSLVVHALAPPDAVEHQ